ncbi:hypothetical protein [Saccharopolyspora sp. NPDC049426]|uniref:hypothetical protein n=1 Tax=Saccharopolyspora sp. NPDC049426 TaxID=3155652 RepID=UPI00342C9DCE
MTAEIPPPPHYRETRIRGLWALSGCADCGGTGEFLVTDDEDPDLRYPQPCDCLWCPEAELHGRLEEEDDPARQAELRAELDRRDAEQARQHIAEEIGPRHVGGRYRSGYSRRAYTVEDISISAPDDVVGPRWSITVRWDNGHVATHYTAWNPDRDEVLSPPPQPSAPVPPRPRGEDCPRCRSRFAVIRAAHRVGLL